MTIQEIFDLMDPAEESLVVWILYLPLVVGFEIPGFWIIVSLLIMWQGARTALHKKFWLPKKLKEKQVSGDHFAHYISYIIRFLKKLEKIAHPRGTIYQHHPLLLTFNGCMMALGGCFLLLPMGTDLVAGLGVILLAVGMLEEDILWMICAYGVFAIHIAHVITLLVLR
jgi:hypothetical protein